IPDDVRAKILGRFVAKISNVTKDQSCCSFARDAIFTSSEAAADRFGDDILN
ncbi:unnamed protein product, partial [Onchocerca ochengi]